MSEATVNGRKYEVGEDGTLLDRRETRQDGIKLNAAERVTLQLMRMCDMPATNAKLEARGLIDEQGLTAEGKILADVLLRVEDAYV